MPSDATSEILQAAIAFVRGVEKNRALYSLTLDHLIYEQIQGIEGGDPDFALSIQGQTVSRRVSKLRRLEELQRSLDAAVETERKAKDV